MKVFTRDYRITGDYHALWADHFGDMKPCVFDIETTGLDRSRCRVVLTGLLTRTESGVRATQFLAENHYEEGKVLEATMDFLRDEGIDYLITYNGAAFDVPFMNARLDACFAGDRLRLYDFDLLRFLRMNTDLKRRIGSLSQKSVENCYGILDERGDTISGRESVMLFDQYALTGNSTIEKIILTHNREDIVHLNRLMYHVMGDLENICTAKNVCGRSGAAANDEGAGAIADDANGAGAMTDAEAPGCSALRTALAVYGLPAAGGRLSVRPSVKAKGRSASGRFASADVGTARSSARSGGMLHITGEQLRDPVSCAFFPDADYPLTVSFNASSSSYEIDAPLGRHGDDYFIDISFLFGRIRDRDQLHASVDALRSDPDCVNDYLILNPRTVNIISRLLAESALASI